MERTDASKKKLRMICPECSNYINGILKENGAIAGQCPICKAVVLSKKCSPRETRIRIIKEI